ncbi:MAG: transcriptional regulator PpsR [Pseudomonadota bacterium]
MTSRGTKYWTGGSIPLIAPDVLGDIISAAADLALVVTMDGNILSVLINNNSRSLNRARMWEGQNVRDFLTPESVPKVDAKLAVFEAGEMTTDMAELNHLDQGQEFPIRYSFHRIGPDGAMLMLGRDLRPIAEMQQQLVKAQVALERDYETQREFDTRYRAVMDATREAMVFVAVSSGRIVDANKSACQMLGAAREDLASAAFAQEFDGRRRGELIESITNAAISGTAMPMPLVTRRSKKRVMISPKLMRAAGERLLLCTLDLTDDVDLVNDELGEDISALYRDGVDAIVFSDRHGVIKAANESFLNLSDAAHLSNVKGRPLSDFLTRGTVDLKVLLENASSAGSMRIYATKLSGEFGNQLSVEISATYLNDRNSPAYVFVIRDASRTDASRRPGVAVSDDAVRSVMELVGSATLKEIVAETTDVIEKMCIETAIELTRNNRVAAAEMLGLSRQSLYVKLRKYGLISRD